MDKLISSTVVSVLAVLLIAVGCASDGTTDPSTVPNIEGVTFDGEQYNLLETTDRPLVINFWYPSCPPCVVELPHFQQAYEAYGDRVDFLAVFSPIVDTEEDARAFIDELGVEFPVIADTSTEAQFEYGVRGYPTTFFISADRTELRRTAVGLVSQEYLEENILMLLNE